MEFARRDSQNDFGIDPLTGALLPTKFNEILAREIMFSKRANTAISVITISISKNAQENFKKISNEKDFLIDEFMVQLVFELRKILRKTDCICRINATGLWLLITNPPSPTRLPEVDQNVLINRVKALAYQVLTKYFANFSSASDLASISTSSLLIEQVVYSGEEYLDYLARIDRSFFLN